MTFNDFKKELSLDDRTSQYETALLAYKNCYLVGKQNDGKTSIVAAYLLWQAISKPNYIIGITASRGEFSRDIIKKIKIMIENSDSFKNYISIYNNNYLELKNGSRIISSPCNGDAFRGYTTNIIFIDEISIIDDTRLLEFMDCMLPVLDIREDSRLITTSGIKC